MRRETVGFGLSLKKIDKSAVFSLTAGWLQQFWAQMYHEYVKDPLSFRLTDGELKQVQIANKPFETSLPFEDEVRALFDYKMPVKKWEWWRAADLAKMVMGYPSVKQIGRVLSKCCKEFETNSGVLSNPPNELTNPPYNRVLHGNKWYLLPIRRY